MASMNKARAAWGRQFDCFLCGWPSSGPAEGTFQLEVHEMVRGCGRSKGVKMAAAWIRVCNACHRIVESWPVARQLALKRSRDPENYDRVAVNLARGRQAEAISEQDVDAWDRSEA